MRSKKVRLISAMAVLLAIALVSYWLLCPAKPRMMQHALTGYVLEVTPEMNRITVRNADIPGTMASMVMDYRVKDASALAGIKPGDVVQATMVCESYAADIRAGRRRPHPRHWETLVGLVGYLRY